MQRHSRKQSEQKLGGPGWVALSLFAHDADGMIMHPVKRINENYNQNTLIKWDKKVTCSNQHLHMHEQ